MGRLKLRYPLPSRRITLQLIIFVLYPDNGHPCLACSLDCQRNIAHDSITVPGIGNYVDLDVDD